MRRQKIPGCRVVLGIFLVPLVAAILSTGRVFSAGNAASAGTSFSEGGSFDSSRLPAASPPRPFSIDERHGIAWLVTPGGKRFFSLGVSCVGTGESRKDLNPKNPGYAAWQHYPSDSAWADATLKRLISWRFTTVGGWSDYGILRGRIQDFAFTPVLHLGSTAGAPWWDMWDPKVISRMDEVARAQILAVRDDPRLLGYYSDNELGWWNAALFRMTFAQAATSGQRQRLLQLLKETYHDDWTTLLRDFEPSGAASWQQLAKQGTLRLRAGGNGIRVMRRFLELIADRYYTLIHDIIRKYDQRALILGDRYQSFFYPEVARAGARHLDIVSTNLNASWNDGTFPRFYLETLHELTGKPVLASEFYMAARNNRTGNGNSHGVYPLVDTQQERAAGFRTTLRALAATPFVVGADWFQYYDEPPHGRGDGEDFNFGLVDIHDRPYQELTLAAEELDLTRLKKAATGIRSDASQGVPHAPPDPFADLQPTLALKSWDRERGFVPPASELPVADLYIAWNEKAVYLGLYLQDIVEQDYYLDKRIPEEDRALWTVTLGSPAKEVQVRLGAGREPASSSADVRVVGISGNARSIAAMELPARLFGKNRFRAGDTIEFTASALTHARADRVDWKGRFSLLAR